MLRRVKEAEQLFITRNNAIEAVLMDIELFERLIELEDLVEHSWPRKGGIGRRDKGEIYKLVSRRLADRETGP